MAARRRTKNEEPESRRPPAITPGGREQQLISLAVDHVERKLRDGTATSQETTHFLKLGSSREELEQQRIRYENELLKARAEAIAAQGRMEELFAKAITAMRTYKGDLSEDEPDYDG